MNAWSGNDSDVMGPTVTRAASVKPSTPPLKNGNELRESGYLIAVGSRTARFRRKHKSKIMTIILIILFLVLLSLVIAMTVLYIKQKRSKPIRICESKECLRSAANLALSMDMTADPCQDFNQYACGNWREEHPRPDSYRSYDWFRDKQIKVYIAVREFLTKNISNVPLPVQQAKDLYTACTDTETLNKRGLKPVYKILESLGLPSYPTYVNVTDDTDYSTFTFDWLEAVIKIKTQIGMDVLIGFDIFTDPKNSSVYRLIMGSPETTNPFPSMINYNKHHSGNKKTRKKLGHKDDGIFGNRNHKNFDEKGGAEKDDKEDKTDKIYKLFYSELIKIFVVEAGAKRSNLTEIELDQNIFLTANEYYTISEDLYELEEDNSTDSDEDPYMSIPEYSVVELQAHTDMIVESNNGTPTPIWKTYLSGVFNVSQVKLDFKKDRILVSEPDLRYLSLMASYISKLPPVVIELYVWTKVVEVLAIHTTTELRTLYLRVYNELGRPSGGDAGSTRSLQCASAVNEQLGLAVSYAIVDPHFHAVTKPKIEAMINDMKNALARLIGKAKWMDDDTKLATYRKIINMRNFVGYPDWLFDEGKLEQYYSGIEVDKKLHLENMIQIIQVKIKKVLNKFRIGNTFSWATDPTEVNAYHTFQENTITIPFVVLHHPFYDLGLDSLNYGSLGTLLGHEITHGFDDYGRQFDKNGNFLPWWTNQTIESFVNRTQCFIDQYSKYYIPEIDEYVDGKKTLGENIADNGGLRESFLAFRERLRKSGPEAKLPGFEHFTSEQLFFLSYGNLWCGVNTKESLQLELEDEHAPQIYRSRGSLQNNEDFARAWHCPAGSPMNPTKRCIIF